MQKSGFSHVSTINGQSSVNDFMGLLYAHITASKSN